MFLRTLITASIAASFLAGCAGGSSSVLTTGAPAASAPQSSSVTFSISPNQVSGTAAKSVRRAQYVAPLPANTAIYYAFVGGTNPTGNFPLSTCNASVNAGAGSTYTCTIVVIPAMYGGLNLTLQSGSTALSNGSYCRRSVHDHRRFVHGAWQYRARSRPARPRAVDRNRAEDGLLHGK